MPHAKALESPLELQCPYGCTLAYMVHRLLDFREAETAAIANMHGLSASDLNMRTLPGDSTLSPFRLIDGVSASHCAQICSRAMLTKARKPVSLAVHPNVAMCNQTHQHCSGAV